MSSSCDNLLQVEARTSLTLYSKRWITEICQLQKAWQDKGEQAHSHFTHFSIARAELAIVSNATDNDFLNNNKYIKDDIMQAIKDCIEDERENISYLVEALRVIYERIHQVSTEALKEVTANLMITSVPLSNDTSISVSDWMELWSDVERVTQNEYVVKKCILEFSLDQNNCDVEKLDKMWQNSLDWGEMWNYVLFLNKYT